MQLRSELEAMRMFLWTFCDKESTVHGHDSIKWTAASLKTARNYERGPYFARKLRQMTHTFISDREELPRNLHKGSKSALDDEDLAQEIHLHLQSIGKYIKAADIVHFLNTPEMLARLKRKKDHSRNNCTQLVEKDGLPLDKRSQRSICRWT
jgi:hypothetical protein